MNPPICIDPQMISSPSHYVQGRKIEPIQVIEEWSFCHHLACVVKYIARLGRKNPILEDLKKAEWYLMREIGTKACQHIGRPQWFPTPPEAITEDWKLSPSLGKTIFCLTSYQRLSYRLSLTKADFLKQALTYLRGEIRNQELNGVKNQDQQPTVLGGVGAAHIRCGRQDSEITINSQPYGTNIIIFKGGNT